LLLLLLLLLAVPIVEDGGWSAEGQGWSAEGQGCRGGTLEGAHL
jgi:hypothetical protein